jgi:DGQHR domain-containing protein
MTANSLEVLPMSDICLVGCCRQKLSHAAPARELYTSPLFQLAARYCSATCDQWFVLSARHGLVEPDQVLEPYDDALEGRRQSEREAWAERVVWQLRQRGLLEAGHRFQIHAGAVYAEFLAPLLKAEQPLRGLPIGRRLSWYRSRLEGMPAEESVMEKTLRLPALEIRQGPHALYCFAVDGKMLTQFAAVSRVRRDGEGTILGYQRPEVLQHVRQIRAYLESADALLPNALVVAFDGRVRFTASGKDTAGTRTGTLAIPLGGSEEEKAAWLVDGQQRAAALREAMVERFPVFVVGFIACSAAEQREQFILVNSTKPLPRGLVHELLPQTDGLLPDALQRQRFPSQLLDRLNRDPDSPLCGLIRTPTCLAGVFKDTSVLRMLANSLGNGGLFFFRDRESGDHDTEGMLHLLKDYWSAVAAAFPEAWARPPRESRLSGGPGVVALGFLMDSIIDRHRHVGLPTRAQFQADLEPLLPVCHWTGGCWDFGPGRRREWNDLQNTPKDVRLLSDHLVAQYKALVWGRGSGG